MSKKKQKTKGVQEVCPWCNHIEELENGTRSEWFTWTSIKNKLVYLCWNCTDKVHSNHIASEIAKEKKTTQNA